MSKNQTNFSIYKDETFNTTVSNLVKWDYSEAFPITATLTSGATTNNLTISRYPLSFPGLIYKNGNMYTLVIQIYSSDITITANSTFTELPLDISPSTISPAINGASYKAFGVPTIIAGTGSFIFGRRAFYNGGSLAILWNCSSADAGVSPTINVNIPFTI